jgi:ferredoxin
MQMTPPEEPPSLDLVAIERLVAAYRLLADPGRLRLVGALLEDRELPVRELARLASRALARNGIARATRRSTYSRRKDAQVTYIIAEPCVDVKDKSCVDVCPVDCIHEGDRILVIDPEECIDCGACEPECPVEAIYPEDVLPEKWEPFVKINYAYGQGLDTVNELVQELVEQSPPPPIPGYRET